MQRCGVLLWPQRELLYDRDTAIKKTLEAVVRCGMLKDDQQLLRLLILGNKEIRLPRQSASRTLSNNFCRYGIQLRGSAHTLHKTGLGQKGFAPVEPKSSISVGCAILLRLASGTLIEYILDERRSRVYSLKHTTMETATKVLFGGKKTVTGDPLVVSFRVDQAAMRLMQIARCRDSQLMLLAVNARLKDLNDLKDSSRILETTEKLLSSYSDTRVLLIIQGHTTMDKLCTRILSQLSEPQRRRVDVLVWQTEVCYLKTLCENLVQLVGGSHLLAQILTRENGGTVSTSFLFRRSRTEALKLFHNHIHADSRKLAVSLMKNFDYTHVFLCGCTNEGLFEHLPTGQRLPFSGFC